MAYPSWPGKAPSEVLDYIIDWSPRLGVGRAKDQIVESNWTVPSGITMTANSFTTLQTVIWLSGGTLDTTYTLTNDVTTLGGRTMSQSVTIKIVQN